MSEDINKDLKILFFKQNSIRHRILACISLCDNIFCDARNKVFSGKTKNELDPSRDFFGTNYSFNLLQKPDNKIIKTKFLEELNNKYLIDINEENFENFEDIFIKINVLRNWLIHHGLNENKNNKKKSSKGNNQNNQKLIEDEKTKKEKENRDKKFKDEITKFTEFAVKINDKFEFNFNKKLLRDKHIDVTLENLTNGLFKILPQDFCHEIIQQLYAFKIKRNSSLRDDNKDEFNNNLKQLTNPEFKKLKEQKKSFIEKINRKDWQRKNYSLFNEINHLKFVFKKNSTQNSNQRKSKKQGKITVDAQKYCFIGKDNYNKIFDKIMKEDKLKEITNEKIDLDFREKFNEKSLKLSNKSSQKYFKSFEEIFKIYELILEINILFRIYFTEKYNELKDNEKENKQKFEKIRNKKKHQRSKQEQHDFDILDEKLKILKNEKFNELRNNIDHSNLLQMLVSQDNKKLSITQKFQDNLQIAIDFIEKYYPKNSYEIAKRFLNSLYQLFAKKDYLFLRFSDENGNYQKINIRFSNHQEKPDDQTKETNSKINADKADIKKNVEKKSEDEEKKNHKEKTSHAIVKQKIKKIIDDKMNQKPKENQDDKKTADIKFNYKQAFNYKQTKLIKFRYYASLKTHLIINAHREILKNINEKNLQKNLGK